MIKLGERNVGGIPRKAPNRHFLVWLISDNDKNITVWGACIQTRKCWWRRPHSSKLFCTARAELPEATRVFCPLLHISFFFFLFFFEYEETNSTSASCDFQWRRVANVTLFSNALPHTVTVKSACCQTVVGRQSSCLFDKVWEGFGGCRWHHTFPDSVESGSPP